ncbi:MAG: VWA domain-containing protein, partial [Candidatus Woesearchaeota archaeon]|nr:VWA domain-containing protein [Candidatus Woesearchaeota archaeon]
MEIVFSNPQNLWLLLTVPILILTHFIVLNFLKRRAFRFANFDVIRRIVGPEGNRKNSQFLSENFVLLILRILAVSFLVLAAAGATLWYQGRGSKFSYVIAVDASSSMLADDMQPNRLEAAKKAAGDFVGMLSLAKVGVIDFSGVSFVRQPITDDLSLSRNAIANIGIEDVGGTAIGDSIITATNLLSQEDNARVVILIT